VDSRLIGRRRGGIYGPYLASKVQVQVQVQVVLQPTVSRQVCLGVGPPSGAHDQIFITVGHLLSSCFGAPSLTRGRVCNLLIQFAVTLRSKSRRTHDHTLLPHLRLLVSLFIASYDSQGYASKSKSKLMTYYDRQSVGQFSSFL
jgi:hypothetical protein